LNALEFKFKFVKEGLSITSTSKWSYEITFDRVADLGRGFGEFGGR